MFENTLRTTVGSLLLLPVLAYGQFDPSGGPRNERAPSRGEEVAGTFTLDEEPVPVDAAPAPGSPVRRRRTAPAPAPVPTAVPAPIDRAVPRPTKGPGEVFVYENDMGIWKVPQSGGLGRGKYSWFDGSKHFDELLYEGHGYVTDRGGYSIPRGTKVSVWAYRASDERGNSMYFYFGTDPIIRTRDGQRYPLYYSWDAPGNGATILRLATRSGTTRF